MKNKNKSKSKLRNDIILIGAILLIAIIGIIAINLKSAGNCAVVISDGKEIARYPLAVKTEEIINIPKIGSNTLVIDENGAHIVKADCPDGICVATGAIQKEGETIVCLPHKLVVKIVSATSENLN